MNGKQKTTTIQGELLVTKFGSSLLVLAAALGVMGVVPDARAQGKDITIVMPEEPDIIDPCHASRSNIGRVVKQNVAETLLEINPADGSVGPRLATGFEQLSEKAWRLKLRSGVKFHDGTPFDAEAAAFSINRTLDTRLDCEIRTKFFGKSKLTPKVVDATTLDIETSEPMPILPTMLGTMTMVSTKTVTDKLTREPIGTGPYVFTSWKPGQNVVLTRFEGYWGAKPQVEKATYVWRGESAVRAAMVKAGEADIAPSIAVQDATDPKMDFSYFDSETTVMRIDLTRKPLDDIRMRKAINMAIDREALRGTILPKDVMPSTQLVVPSINGHNPDLIVWKHDPAGAKKLIAEAKAAGTDVSKEIVLIARRGVHAAVAEEVEAYLAMLKDVGLNVRLQMTEVAEWNDIYTKPYADDRPASLFHAMHDNNNGDAVFTVFNKYHSEGAQSVLTDKKLDATIEAAQVATGDKRRQLWREAFKIVADDIVGDVPLFHMVGYTRVGPRVNFKPSISTNSEIQISQVTFK